MKISKRVSGEVVELKVEGRLDGYWADHLAGTLHQEIRNGVHHLRVDLSEVAFLSSAGIGVLVRFYKELKSIQGSFAVSNCSSNVLKVLQLSKLEEVLVGKGESGPIAGGKTGHESSNRAIAPTPIHRLERYGAIYEVYPLAPESKLECMRLGDPSQLASCGFDKEHCRPMHFSDSTFAIGLGALGGDFDDCRRRFGEFIAVGGAVSYLPTDGTNVPDFLLPGGTAFPEVHVCYGIACYGVTPQPFSTVIRFEAQEGTVPIPLSILLESCLEFTCSERIGVVIIAESAGLIGAALRRSPVISNSEAGAFEFPRIRDWLSFTTERAYTKSVVLSAGVAVRDSVVVLAPVIRPFASPEGSRLPLSGHFHAAAFSYRPVPKGQIDLKDSIKTLFETQTLEGILHLLTDDRAMSTGTQSELVRGACWVAPISHVTVG
jgi:anti-anti-sigma factor